MICKKFNTIEQLITQQAKKRPNAPALLNDHLILDYSSLSNQIQQLIYELRQGGVDRHDRVAIILPNGIGMALSFLAVSSCAISAPLNPNYTLHELKFYLQDLAVNVVITTSARISEIEKILPDQDQVVFALFQTTHFHFASEKIHKPKLVQPPQADDIALLLHTSGTTSRPKLVPLTHHNLLLSACNVVASLALIEDDRGMNIMPLFHIHGLVAALLAPLLSGGSVICTDGFQANTFYCLGTLVKTMHFSARL